MVAAQVIGNDATIAIAGQSGNFQLNVMLPVIAYNLLQSIELLANARAHAGSQRDRRIRRQHAADRATRSSRNPMLVTALNPVIGYDKARGDREEGLRRGPTRARGRRRDDGPRRADDWRGCSIRRHLTRGGRAGRLRSER